MRIQPLALLVAMDAWREPVSPGRDRRARKAAKAAKAAEAAAQAARSEGRSLDLAPYEIPAGESADAKRPADRFA